MSLVVDDHDRRLAFGVPLGVAVVLVLVAVIVWAPARFSGQRLSIRRPLGARLGLHLGRARRHDALAARERRELLELALAEHGRRGERVPALRHGRGDVEAERVHEAPELREVRRVLRVGHARELDADEDGAHTLRTRGVYFVRRLRSGHGPQARR